MMIRSTITLTENKPSKVTTNLEGQSGMQEGLENGKAATPPPTSRLCVAPSALIIMNSALCTLPRTRTPITIACDYK